MKISIKSSSAAKNGVARFPTLNLPVDACQRPDGRWDRAKLISALYAEDGTVLIGSEDPEAVLVFGACVIERLNEDMLRFAEKTQSKVMDALDVHPTDRAEKRMAKGTVAFCSVKISYRRTTDTISVRIGWNNRLEVVGMAEEFARDNAILMMQVCMALRDIYADAGSEVGIVCEGDAGCEDLPVLAVKDMMWRRERQRIEADNQKRGSCEHRRVCFCEGLHKDCACYRNGRCEEAKVPEYPI